MSARSPRRAGSGAGGGIVLARRRFIGATAALLTAALARSALAAETTWPAKPIRFVMTAPPGSSIDVLGRILAERLRERLGPPVVVENLAAAGGTGGTAAVARAPADGTTFGLAFNGPLAFAPHLYDSLPYDPQRDLTAVVLVSRQPNVLAVNASLPVRSVQQLVDLARTQPGKLNYASVGNGTSSHLTMELFKSVAGLYVVHIPFNGAPPAAASVAADDTQMLFAVPTAINAHLQSGKLRAIAVTSAQRYVLLPELPTFGEAGYPAVEATAWNGIVAPAATPMEIVAKLNREVNEILRESTVRAKMNAAGLEPAGGTSEAFAQLIRSEAARWAPVIRRTGAKID